MRNGQYFVHSTHEIQMLLPSALFCHKASYFPDFRCLFVVSRVASMQGKNQLWAALCHKDTAKANK